jgi:hypothetical protein
MIRIEENTGQVPSEQLMTDMGKLIEELTRTGQLISTAGLRPTSEGVRVRLRRGKLSLVDGPFTETKEVIGGYAILDVKSKEEVIELTRRFLKITGSNGRSSAKCASWTGRSSVPRRELHPSCSPNGSFRMRLPVAANTALASAGMATEVPGSPTPPGACALGNEVNIDVRHPVW